MPEAAKEQPTPEATDVKKDPVMERTQNDLKEINKDKDDTKQSLDKKIARLQVNKDGQDGLTEKYNKAVNEHKDRQAADLNDTIARIDARIAELDAAKATAAAEADTKFTKVADRLGNKAEVNEGKEKNIKDLNDEIAALDKKIGDASTPAAEKSAALRERADKNDQLKPLENRDKHQAFQKKAEAMRAEEDRIRSEEIEGADQMIADLAAGKEVSVEAPEATPETPAASTDKAADTPADAAKPAAVEKISSGDNLKDRGDTIASGIAKEIVNSPAKGTAQNIVLSVKTFLLKFFAKTHEATWTKDLSNDEKDLLQKEIGLKITDNPVVAAKEGEPAPVQTAEIEWVDPDKDFKAPTSPTQNAFTAYVRDNWIPTYDDISKLAGGNPKTSDVTASFSDPLTEENMKIKALVDDLKAEGVKDGDLFLDAINNKGNQLPKVKGDKVASGTDAPGKASDANTDLKPALEEFKGLNNAPNEIKDLFLMGPDVIKANPQFNSQTSKNDYTKACIESDKFSQESHDKLSTVFGADRGDSGTSELNKDLQIIKENDSKPGTLKEFFEAFKSDKNDQKFNTAIDQALAALKDHDPKATDAAPVLIPLYDQPGSAPTVTAAPSKPKLPEPA